MPDKDAQVQLADLAIREAWSVRVIEQKVKELALGKPAAAPGDKTASPSGGGKGRPVWLNELEENLVEALGTTVTIRYGKKRSQITIECSGREEFERIYNKLKNTSA